jgi:hypothetical protein
MPTGTDVGTSLNQITETEILPGSNLTLSHPVDEATSKEIETFFDTHTETKTTVKHILSQTTSIPQSSTTTYVADFNISAYMRKQEIDIFSYNLRPNRKIFPYFDDKSILNLFERANIIEVDNDNEFISIAPSSTLPLDNIDGDLKILGQIDTGSERIYTSTGSARVYFTEKTDTGTTRLYVDCFETNVANIKSVLYGTSASPSGTANVNQINGAVSANGFAIGDTIYGSKSGSMANIVFYQHNTGKLSGKAFNSNTQATYGLSGVLFDRVEVSLSKEASDEDGFYVGRSLTVLTGSNPGETTEIIAYDGNTKSCIVSPAITGFNAPGTLYYTLGDERDTYASSYGNNSVYTTSEGFLVGKFRLPNPGLSSYYRWRTGDKLLKITDSPSNKSADASTIAEYIYTSFGLSISKGQTVINYFVNENDNSPVKYTDHGVIGGAAQGSIKEPLPTPATVGGQIQANTQQIDAGTPIVFSRRYNPIAQSFYVSPEIHPKGFFIPYIDLFFAKKGTLPVSLEIRPLINGVPDSKNIVPGAVSVVPANQVKVSAFPNTSNSLTYTRFTFNSPVYVLPDADYVFTVGSNDYDYEMYVSELGETTIGTNRVISSQPYLGSLFKSQNSSTYDAIQSEDIMFVIHKCQFVSSGYMTFSEEKLPNIYESAFNRSYDANTVYDCFEVQSDVIQVPGTDVSYQYKSRTAVTDTQDADYINFKPDRRVILPSRKVVKGPTVNTESFFMQVDMTTTNRDISPIIYKEKQHLHTTGVMINNMGLSTRGVSVSNTGTGYTFSNTSVSFTANTGSGANAMALIQFQDYLEGRIDTLYFDQVGSGYYDNVEIILANTVPVTTKAALTFNAETDPSGGPAVARYISKIVTLSPEFEAGDLRVYLTAIKPPEAEIQVYYKVNNPFDSETIDSKRWTRMARKSGPYKDTVGFNPMEYEYAPSLESNNVVYQSGDGGTFSTFNQFKIKIVLASSDTVLTKIPYVYDMRAIALPGDVS